MKKIVWLVRLVSVYILFSTVCISSVLSPDMFNQSVNAGSEEALGIRYQQQPSYQLVIGDQPARETGWESHSTLTTGLFPLRAGDHARLRYAVKADNHYQQPPVLWTEVRYFDQHGVNIAIARGHNQTVAAKWHQRSIQLAPHQPEIAYAEVWFVKYQSGQRDDDDSEEVDKTSRNTNSDDQDDKQQQKEKRYYSATIYLSDIKLE